VVSTRPWATATLALPFLCGFIVWNGVLDLHVSRGERRYLLEQARHELGQAAEPSLSAILGDAVRSGARQATWWAVLTGGLTLSAGLAGRRWGLVAARRALAGPPVDDAVQRRPRPHA